MPDTDIGGSWHYDRVSVLLGDGNCGFRPAPGSPFPAGAVPWGISVGDLDGDGNLDLLIHPYGPQVRDPKQVGATILLGDGKGGFHPMPGSPLALPGCESPSRSAIGDVNGDGISDFVVTCMHTDTILVFMGRKGGGFQISPLTVPTGSKKGPSAGYGVVLAELTGSGKDDIIVANGEAGTITILFSR